MSLFQKIFMKEAVMTFIIIFLVTLGGLLSTGYCIYVYSRAKKAKFAEEEGEGVKIEQSSNLDIRELLKLFTDRYLEFRGLGKSYYIERERDYILRRCNEAKDMVRGGSADEIEKAGLIYRELIGRLEKFIKHPDDYLGKGFRDFLDDSILVAPVNLAINHPKLGHVIVKVNKHNAER